jgi:site-specific recombinase XerD
VSRARLTRAQALSAFERSRVRSGFAPGTVALEQRVLRAALARLGRRALARVTVDDLRLHLARRARRVGATTLSRELAILGAFFRFLAAEGLIRADPSQGLTTRPGQARPPLLLSKESVGKLLGAALEEPRCHRSPQVRRARALRARALLELLYGLGLRAAEAAAVRVVDLDLRSASLLVRRVKRGKPRQLPLPASALPELERYLREGRRHLVKPGQDTGHLLLTERGTPLCGNEVLRIVKAVGERAGLRAHPHAIRRALATHLVQAGSPLPLVRELLGHVRLDTTQRYVLVEREDLRRAVEVLDRRRGASE